MTPKIPSFPRQWIADHARQAWSRPGAVAFASSSTLLLAAYVNFLKTNSYPLLRVETGLVAAGILLGCSLMTPFYLGQRRWGRAFLEVLLVFLVVDLVTEGLLYPLVAAALAGACLVRSRSLVRPAAIMGSVMLLTTLAGIGPSEPWLKIDERVGSKAPVSSLPPILHIVLDEHIGIEGIPAVSNDGKRLREELSRFYGQRAFTLYDRAYSQHGTTIYALPSMLNYGSLGRSSGSREGGRIGESRYFKDLRDMGYTLEVMQTDFIDICSDNNVSACFTYKYWALGATLTLPMPTLDRVTLILRRLSGLLDFVPDYLFLKGTSPFSAIAASDFLAKRLEAAAPRTVYYAHLLMPHGPYVTRADCSVLPLSEWRTRASRASLENINQRYLDQVRCSMHMVDKLTRALSRSPNPRKAIVIIHGDHGARLYRRRPGTFNVGEYDDADALSLYSTFAAFRAPIEGPGHYTPPASVAGLLHEFVRKGLRAPPAPPSGSRPEVYLADEEWRPRHRVVLRGW